jgi:hypothetical protein
MNSQAPVAHTCNPSYSGGRDQEDGGLKPVWTNSLRDPILKNPSQKKGWWSDSRWSPWVQAPIPLKVCPVGLLKEGWHLLGCFRNVTPIDNDKTRKYAFSSKLERRHYSWVPHWKWIWSPHLFCNLEKNASVLCFSISSYCESHEGWTEKFWEPSHRYRVTSLGHCLCWIWELI